MIAMSPHQDHGDRHAHGAHSPRIKGGIKQAEEWSQKER